MAFRAAIEAAIRQDAIRAAEDQDGAKGEEGRERAG